MAVTGRGTISNVTVSLSMGRMHWPSWARQVIANAPAKTALMLAAVISKKSVQEKKIARLPIWWPFVISLNPFVGVNMDVKISILKVNSFFIEFESIETCRSYLHGYRYIDDSQESTKL